MYTPTPADPCPTPPTGPSAPHVPVFRDSHDRPLAQPWPADFLTSSAHYEPRIGQPGSAHLLARRLVRVLAIAQAFGYRNLVLGVWGCGAFHNDPVDLARQSRAALEGPFRRSFERVAFAIPGSPETSTNLAVVLEESQPDDAEG